MKYSFFGRLTAVVLMAVVIFTLIPASVFAQIYYGSNNNAMPSWRDIPYQTVSSGNTLSLSVDGYATDNNGDYLTFAGVSLPDGASFDGLNRLFIFTPRVGQLGTYAVTLSATDNKSQPVFKTFYVGVSNDYNRFVTGGGYFDGYNQAPYFSGTESYYQIRSGSILSFRLNAIDPDNSPIFYSSSNLPAGASWSGNSGEFRWAPVRNQRGTYNLQFLASDGALNSAAMHVTIVVDGGLSVVNQIIPVSVYNNPNQVTVSSVYGQPVSPSQGGPYFTTSPSLTGNAGQTYIYNAQAYDPSGYQVAYALTLAPEGAYINPSTGVLAWTAPSNAVTAPYRFTINAMNNQGLSASQSFDLSVFGGVAKTSTVVQYVSAPFDYAQGKPAQTVATVNYSTPTYQSAYQQVSDGAFNIAFRPNENNETIVSWDTAKASRGEVVFGFNAQPVSTSQGGPTSRLLNYDFTTGQTDQFATHHEISLGKLELNRTYYMRAISRTGSETDIAGEVIMIPMPYAPANGGQVNINNQQPVVYNTASAADTLGSFLGSGWLLLFLAVIIIVLTVYLLTMKRK